MAKSRRVVRKVKHYQSVIEDQLWPVIAALCVLGGFLMGVVLAYLRLDDPRWYVNAATYLFLVPVLVGAGMVGAAYLPKRYLRRTMQFALLIAMALHVLLMVLLIETEIIKPFWEPSESHDLNRRELVHVPTYHPLQMQNPEERPQHDFERPVEVETPDPETPEVDREPPEPEQQPEPDRPEPTPTPPEEPTVKPNVVQKQTPAETAPRAADTTSQLSRQQRTTQVRPTPAEVATPQVAQPTAQQQPQATAQQAEVQRNQAEAQQVRRTEADQPTATTPQAQPQLTRRTSERSPLAQTSTTPTMQRQVNEPQVTPSSQAAVPETTAQPQQTRPDQVQPNNIAATRQQSAAPPTQRPQVEVTPNASAVVETQTQRRQSPAETAPQVAQSPRSTPNQRRQVTATPQVQTQTAVEAPSRAPVQSQSQPTQVADQTSPVQRRQIETPVQRMATAQPTPEPSPTTTPTQVTRSQSNNAPTPNTVADATPTTPRRQNANSPVAPQSTSQVVPTPGTSAPSPSTSVAQVQPAEASMTRQTSNAPAVTPNAEATPAPSMNVAQASPAQPQTTRASNAEPAPTVARTTQPTPNQRTATQTAPSPTSTAAATVSDAPVNSAPSPSQTAALRANTGAVNRQANASPSVSRPETATASPSASPSTQVARNAPARAESSSAPTIASNAAPSASPRRTERSAAVAASPTAVESPATSETARTASNPSAEPARMAINKSQGGTAGIGQSANMERALPTTGSVAPVASSSARRATATQADDAGPALTPTAPATIARSVAGAQTPSAARTPTTMEVASTAGAEQASEIAASSSAAVTRADSNAESGEVTAAKGQGEIDLGPTQLVSEPVEPNKAGDGSGGGQPTINTETQSNQIARAESGGSVQATVAAQQVANLPVAPAADGGGQPMPLTPSLEATAAVRSEAGDVSPVTGGPATAIDAGEPAETSTAEEVTQHTEIARATAIDAESGDPTAGGGAPEVASEGDQPNMARAESASAPQLATSGPEVPAAAMAAAAPEGSGEPEEDETEEERLARIASAKASGEAGGAPASAASMQAGPPTEITGGQLLGDTALARAETIESAPGQPTAGGGSSSPARSETGPRLSVNMTAEVPTLAGAPDSAGEPDGTPIDAQGQPVDKVAEGGAVPAHSGPVGAMAAESLQVAQAGAAPGRMVGERQAGPHGEDGPSIADTLVVGGPGRRSTTDAAPATGTVAEIPVPAGAVAMAEGPSAAGADAGEMGMESTEMSRQATAGSTAVNIEASEGPGGLGEEYALEVGVMNRRAQRDSQEVHIKPARFVRSEVGGQPSINSTAVVSSEAFSGRSGLPDRRGMDGPQGGGAPSPETEVSIEAGLSFLARHQASDGSWSLNNFGAGRPEPQYEDEGAILVSDTAATALSLLAFQGAGYHHKEHQYKGTCAAALAWLVDNQQDDGNLFISIDDRSNQAVWLYSHAIATLALCEAYGMTQDPQLREPTQKALDFIVASQHESRGGWRYAPNFGADTSVTGWMMMALKSGELANLDVPAKTYVKIEDWLDAAQEPNAPYLYRYNPWAPNTAEQRHGREASKTMTSVGLLMRLYSGWKRDNPNMQRGADYLAERLPAIGTKRDRQRDTYYWYYGTQVMFHMGGEHWEQWNGKLHPLLVNSQETSGPLAGSWDPLNPVRDAWGPHAGRIYVTTMNLLSLEVYYRHLPIYEETAK